MVKLSKIHKITLPLEGPLKEVNTYLLEGEQLTLVDVGEYNINSWNTLKKELNLLGYTPSDIKNVVITHNHFDHSSGLYFFSENIRVFSQNVKEALYIQEIDVICNYIENYAKILGLSEEIKKNLVSSQRKLDLPDNNIMNVQVNNGDILVSAPDFTIIETPGHSTNHISLFRKDDGIIIGGDVLIKDVYLNTIFEPPKNNTHEHPKLILSYNETLIKLKNLNSNIILPGHGDPIENIEEFINLQFIKQNKRLKRVKKLLRENPHSIFDLCVKLFPGFYKVQFILVFSDTVAMLNLLEESNELLINKNSEPWIFSLK